MSQNLLYASVAVGVLISALPVQAATVTFNEGTNTLSIDGMQYSLSVEKDKTLGSLLPALTANPWFESADSAQTISSVVEFGLGFFADPAGFDLSVESCFANIAVTCQAIAPYFVFREGDTHAAFTFETLSVQVPGSVSDPVVDSGIATIPVDTDFNAGSIGFVVATPQPIPEPLTVLGSLSALGIGIWVKYQHKRMNP